MVQWRKEPTQATGVNNPETHIVSGLSSLDELATDSCELWLLLAEKRLGFAVVENHHKKIFSFTTYQIRNRQTEGLPEDEYRKILDQEKLFERTFSAVRAVIHNRWLTLIPDAYFEPDKIPSLLHFNLSGVDKGIEGHYHHIPGLQSHIAFGVPDQIVNLLSEKFRKPVFYHASSVFLHSIITNGNAGRGNEVFANIESRYFDVVILQNGQLQFFNQFHFRTTKDFIYYLLLACDDYGLDRDQLQLTLSGDITEDSAIYKIVYKYIRHIHFAGRPAGLDYPSEMEKLPPHSHQNLLSLALCG